MEFFLNRYRNLSVLLVAILAQLALLAYQVKSNQDVRLIRVWAYGAVTPLARVIEAGRSGISRFFPIISCLLGVREENETHQGGTGNRNSKTSICAPSWHGGKRQGTGNFQAHFACSRTLAAHNIGGTTDTGRESSYRRSRLPDRHSEGTWR